MVLLTLNIKKSLVIGFFCLKKVEMRLVFCVWGKVDNKLTFLGGCVKINY